MFVFEPIELNDVILNDKIKYNSNNHWENDKRPDDYDKVISLTHANNWINNFKNNYHKFIINDEFDMEFLQKANKIGKQTGKFSNLYKDELNDFIDKYNEIYGHLFINNTPYFVRTENVSLKCGQHGKGPYTNLSMIIESLTTCSSTHTPICNDTKEIVIYLIPWVIMNEKYEFRIFVYFNKITCISQQHCYKNYNYTKDELNNFSGIIVDYFESNIKTKIKIDSYVYDFVILQNDEPYFIEINSFGKEYASGSSLFHWLTDEKKLYGHYHKNIFVRYIK
jgi:hypothetical protein